LGYNPLSRFGDLTIWRFGGRRGLRFGHYEPICLNALSLDEMMLKKEIADLLDKESYRIWDTTKVIKNQDYHDGLVKGLKMAAKFVRNQI
jgi:hypothetical protein